MRTQDRNLLPVSFNSPALSEARRHRYATLNSAYRLLSSEAERRAHNPEAGGSKPPGGIFQFVCFSEALRHRYLTLNNSNLSPVWRRGSALLKLRILLLDHPPWYDLNTVIGLHHRGRRIETYRRYHSPFSFSSLSLFIPHHLLLTTYHDGNYLYSTLKIILLLYHLYHTRTPSHSLSHSHLVHYYASRLLVPRTYLLRRLHVVHHPLA